MLPLRRHLLRNTPTTLRRFYATNPGSNPNAQTVTDNPVPANNPNKNVNETPFSVSSTNAMPISSIGSQDAALQETPEEGEEKRVMQAPNRAGIWSRSQQPRAKAMVGPRFEQTIMEDQVSKL
jgi:NADH dehydrogenase (ubiquinone) Fe-S protein 6